MTEHIATEVIEHDMDLLAKRIERGIVDTDSADIFMRVIKALQTNHGIVLDSIEEHVETIERIERWLTWYLWQGVLLGVLGFIVGVLVRS